MSDISKRIDTVSRNGLAQELKAAGFRKAGRTWRRQAGPVIHVTNLQASSWNSADSGQFTLNLGVYFPDAARLHGAFRSTETPVEADCIVRQRIGFLLPEGKDFWWEVTPSTDLGLLGHRVAASWAQVALPWLQQHTDPLAARSFLEARKLWWWCAIFSLMTGAKDEARLYLDKAFDEAGSNVTVRAHLTSWQMRTSL